MADVFISYKSSRRNCASFVSNIISAHNYSAWFDYWLLAGSDFGTQIEQQLRGAKACITLWCTESVKSKWVLEEAHLADKLDIIIPVQIEPVELPLGFARLQTIDLSAWDGDPTSSLLKPLIEELDRRTSRRSESTASAIHELRDTWESSGRPSLIDWPLVPPVEWQERAPPQFSEARVSVRPRRTGIVSPVGSYESRDPEWYHQVGGHWVRDFMRAVAPPSQLRDCYFSSVWASARTPRIFTHTKNEGALRIWDADTGAQIGSSPFTGRIGLRGSDDPISPNAQFVICDRTSYRGAAVVDLSTGVEAYELPDPFKHPCSWRWLSDHGLIVLARKDGKLWRASWSAAEGISQIVSCSAPERLDAVCTHHRVLGRAGGRQDEPSTLWDEGLNVLSSHGPFRVEEDSSIRSSSDPFSTDGKYYWLRTSEAGVTVFKSETGEPVNTFFCSVTKRGSFDEAGSLTLFDFVGDDRAMQYTRLGELTCWDLQTGATIFEKRVAVRNGANNLTSLLNGEAVLVTSIEGLVMIDGRTGETVTTIQGDEGPLHAFGNGKYAAQQVGKSVAIYSV